MDLVPPVIQIDSVSTPGSLILSWVSVVRVLSAGKLFSCREGTQRSGAQLCLWAKDEGPKGSLSQKLCCFCSLPALLCRLVSAGPRIEDGSLTCSGGQSPPWRPPLLWSGKCTDVSYNAIFKFDIENFINATCVFLDFQIFLSSSLNSEVMLGYIMRIFCMFLYIVLSFRFLCGVLHLTDMHTMNYTWIHEVISAWDWYFSCVVEVHW